jgi:hypothetical protein
MPSIERTGLASQVLQQAEIAKQNPDIAVPKQLGETADPSAPKQTSAQSFQAKLKLKEAPLDLASDRQDLQTSIQTSGTMEIPDSLNRSQRFQTFMQAFFETPEGPDHPTSQDVLQMQAQFLNPRTDSDSAHV